MSRWARLLAFLLAAFILILPTTTQAQTKGRGQGGATGGIADLRIGNDHFVVGADQVLAVRDEASRAIARLLVAQANATKVGSQELSADAAGSKEQAVAARQLAVGNLLSVGVNGGSLNTAVGDDVSAGVSLGGDASVLGGLVSLVGAASENSSKVTATQTQVTRSLRIDELNVLDLEGLLDGIGVDPLALACAAVEDLGGLLGVDTSTACEQLDTLNSLINSLISQLNSVLTTVEATRDQVNGAIDQLQGALDSLIDQRDELLDQVPGLGVNAAQLPPVTVPTVPVSPEATPLPPGFPPIQVPQLPDPPAPPGGGGVPNAVDDVINDVNDSLDDFAGQLPGIDTVEELLAALNGQIDNLQDQIGGLELDLNDLLNVLGLIDGDLVGSTCGQILGVVDRVLDNVPQVGSALDPATAQVEDLCATLQGLLDNLLDTTLLTLEGVDLSVKVDVKAGEPLVDVNGTLGSIKVAGLSSPIDAVPLVDDTINAVESQVEGALAQITALTGLTLPVPSIEVLSPTSNKGQRPDGTWFAEGALSAVRVTVPSASIDLPDVPGLGVLDGSPLGSLSLGAGYRAAQVATPAMDLAVGSIAASGDLLPGSAQETPGAPATPGQVEVLPGSQVNPSPSGSDGSGTAGAPAPTGGSLPRTGAALVLPLIAASMVLLDGGALLRHLSARRRPQED